MNRDRLVDLVTAAKLGLRANPAEGQETLWRSILAIESVISELSG